MNRFIESILPAADLQYWQNVSNDIIMSTSILEAVPNSKEVRKWDSEENDKSK